MNCCLNTFGWLVLGLIAGAIARLLVPGDQKLGIFWTILLGIIGSYVGGGIYYLMNSVVFGGADEFQVGGWISSIMGATIVLAIWVNMKRKG
ncbi:MAG: GlsB/YeaQ/YmgE family stress response membrane protein [bacterium]|nr:GlsB/YeaQ/YmgE family stress response membrane protein [bacterium]